MKVLIVDDSNYKTEAVVKGLETIALGEELDISQALDKINALNKIVYADSTGEPFDLVVLDMQFPDDITDGFRINELAGLDVLDELKELRISVPVIINTSTVFVEEILKKKYSNVIGYIHYDSQSNLADELLAHSNGMF